MVRIVFVLACTLLLAAPAAARQRSGDAGDGVELLVRQLEEALNANDRDAYRALFSPVLPDEQVDRVASDLFTPGAVRTVVRERDRAPLEGVPEGEGHQLVVEFFVEMAGRARILTAGIDVQRPPAGPPDSWRVVGAEGLTSVEGLYKLRLNAATQYAAKDLTITSEDFELVLPSGNVFLIDSDDGVTGMVLVGRGEMRFAPAPATERGQLRIFSGSETLDASFDSAFVRVSPSDYRRRVTTSALTSVGVDPRTLRRAQEVFERESPKSFGVDLQDLSRDPWHLLPPVDDFLAEVQTRRHGTLTFSRAGAQAEDVSLFHRERKLTIALYPSAAKLAARGRFYSDDLLREYDVLDYNIEASISPERQFIQGRARLAMRVRTSLSTLTLRLAEPLAVSSVTSVEYGRLLHLRVRNQNMILVNMPRTLVPDSDVTLVITYAGRVEPQLVETETLRQDPQGPQVPGDFPFMAAEPNYLLSNRSYWYPQNPVSDYATATMRLVVPEGYGCIASGEPVPTGNVVTLRDLATMPNGKAFVFRANQPLRYLAFVVSRFVRVVEETISLADETPAASDTSLSIAVETNPRQQSRGRAVVRPMEDVLRFYTALMGDAPYTSTTLAVVESDLPGGHSPGYFAVLNQPVGNSSLIWRNDPAAFDGFPEFFLAHELAHQWWGQAVGWKNYHEQWISEGFAQYFAALYAQKARGDRVFTVMLRQFRRWGIEESDQGPVHLGYRLGHIKSDMRVYRALVYNKGAAVLHMLRRLLGDEVFFNGLRRFYEDRKFQKAGTDDLERAFEAESGRTLDRFFERWIYGTDIPRVTWTSAVRNGEVIITFEQLGDAIFDLPVTVSVTYSDGRSEETVVEVSERRVEQSLKASGVVRRVYVNRDWAALADFNGR